MRRRSSKTNPRLNNLIQELKKLSSEQDAPIWKDIAVRLEKPLRNWPAVNIDKIDRYINDNEIALIPGKVLSSGALTKKVTVAAWAFSNTSVEKIKKAGGKTLTIEDLIKKHPKGENIRILG
jgi:large subunit ribosomal protein L18e